MTVLLCGAGYSDGHVVELAAARGRSIFTNYFNQVNRTEVDLPRAPEFSPATAWPTT
jgi:hypothetical protein